jgi:hypothetical protein
MPLDGSKLDRALASAAALTTRMALFQTRADATFNEADHPRAPDVKFGSGGGSSAKLVGKHHDLVTKVGFKPSEHAPGVYHGDYIDKSNMTQLDSFMKLHGFQHVTHTNAWTHPDGTHVAVTANDLSKGSSLKITPPNEEGSKTLDYKSLKRIGPQLGSNPGGRFATPEGKSFYVKQSKSNDHAKNEVTAARLYELAGSPVLRSEPVDMGSGKLGTATEWKDVKNIDRKSPAEVKEAQKDFATHAWLANWDSVGLDYDNQGKIGGKMTTLDVGGSLLYRAQGAPKGDAFGKSAKEWDSLRDPSNRQAHTIFGSMSPEALRESARRVAAVPDEAIRSIVEESGPGSEEKKKALGDLLIARKEDIARRAGLDARGDGFATVPEGKIRVPIDAATVPEGKVRVASDDANWKEGDHPRDADGKFTSGGGHIGKAISAYKSSLKAGKKGNGRGLIKSMLLTGKFSAADILAAAKEAFGINASGPGYLNWHIKDLEKEGVKIPPVPEKSVIEEEPEAKDPGDKIAGEKELENFKLSEPDPVPSVTTPPSVKKKALMDYVLSKNIIGIADTRKLMEPILAYQSPGMTLMNQFNTSMNVLANACVELGNDDREAINDSLVELTGALAVHDNEVSKSALAKLKPFGANSPNPAAQKYNAVLQNILDIYDISGTPAGETSTVPEAPKPDPAKEALKSAASSPPKTAGDVKELHSKIAAVNNKNVGDKTAKAAAIHSEFASLAEHWDKILPDNQAVVGAQLQAFGNILSQSSDEAIKQALGDTKPLTGGGLAKDSANKILAALQNAYGASPTSSKPAAPAYKPSTPVQQAVYEKAKILPHAKQDSATWFESSTGSMLKSRLRTDTSKIPGDYYAKAVSAYGADPNNGMQGAVDKVMSEYSNHQRHQVITPEENKVVAEYKDGDYHDMNNPLIKNKGKLTTPRQKKLQEAIRKCVVPADTPSWRGMSASLQDLSGFDDAEHSIGRCFEHYNFASCSRNRDTSSNFGDKVMLHFKIPAGAAGLVVDGSGEREIVLPARSMFRIDKVEQKPTGYGGTAKHVVYCTYLGEREDE